MKLLTMIAATSALALAAPEFSLAQSPSNSALAQFHEYSEDSRLQINYEAFSGILRDIVLEVGHSDRRLPGRRVIVTGTSISPESSSRYRYEGNRIAFHLMGDRYDAAISDYRQELEELPDQVPLASLNANEQLAYWLNLHNVVVLDVLNREYPLGNVDSLRVDGVPLFDAKIITVEGVSLSLNDIRLRIVGEGWNDPRVVYGFFMGAIGGPSLTNDAFTGRRVWTQLDAIGREFVNARRGVDVRGNAAPTISPYYQDFSTLFPNDEVLLTHLNTFAGGTVQGLLDRVDNRVRYSRFDWDVADLTNGQLGCGGASGNPLLISGGRSAGLSCNALPPQARRLMEVVIERRLRFLRNGDLGRVTVQDIPTEDPGDREGGEPESE